MKKWYLIIGLLIGLSIATFAQQNNNQQQPPSSLFNIDQLLQMDLSEMFNMLEQEMSSSQHIWGQYFDQSFMDTSLMQLKGLDSLGTFDTIFNKLQNQLFNFDFGDMNMGGFDKMIQNFMQDFGSGGFNFFSPSDTSTISPQDLNNGGWQIVPDVPKEEAKPKVDKTKVSEI